MPTFNIIIIMMVNAFSKIHPKISIKDAIHYGTPLKILIVFHKKKYFLMERVKL